MQIEGTATISLETLDELRKKAESAEEAWKKVQTFEKEVMAVYSFETEAYNEELKKIDSDRSLSDEQAMKKINKAMTEHLKIVVDAEALKKLIRRHINGRESEEHSDIEYATDKELKDIQVMLKGQQEILT